MFAGTTGSLKRRPPNSIEGSHSAAAFARGTCAAAAGCCRSRRFPSRGARGAGMKKPDAARSQVRWRILRRALAARPGRTAQQVDARCGGRRWRRGARASACARSRPRSRRRSRNGRCAMSRVSPARAPSCVVGVDQVRSAGAPAAARGAPTRQPAAGRADGMRLRPSSRASRRNVALKANSSAAPRISAALRGVRHARSGLSVTISRSAQPPSRTSGNSAGLAAVARRPSTAGRRSATAWCSVRQAGRREHRLDAQLGVRNRRSRPLLACVAAMKSRTALGAAQALEVDLLGEQLAQRVQVQRVELRSGDEQREPSCMHGACRRREADRVAGADR